MDFSLQLGKEVLRGTPDSLHAMLSGLSEERLIGNDGLGTWSLLE
jgi:hypothetical protein